MEILTPQGHHRHQLLLLFTPCMQPAQSPGYHSNSDYRPPVVNHHIINTHTHTDGKQGWQYSCAQAHEYCTHTLPCTHAHSYSGTNVYPGSGACSLRSRRFHTITNNLITVFLICICQMLFSCHCEQHRLFF